MLQYIDTCMKARKRACTSLALLPLYISTCTSVGCHGRDKKEGDERKGKGKRKHGGARACTYYLGRKFIDNLQFIRTVLGIDFFY